MKNITRVTLAELKHMKPQTDWERVDKMTDQEIARAIKEDIDSAPELTEAWFKNAKWVKEAKEVLPIHLDQSVAEFLRRKGNNYHFWLNEMLKDFMDLSPSSTAYASKGLKA